MCSDVFVCVSEERKCTEQVQWPIKSQMSDFVIVSKLNNPPELSVTLVPGLYLIVESRNCLFYRFVEQRLANVCQIDPFSFMSSIILFSAYFRNLCVNYSHAGVHGAQRRWGVVQVSFNQR